MERPISGIMLPASVLLEPGEKLRQKVAGTIMRAGWGFIIR